MMLEGPQNSTDTLNMLLKRTLHAALEGIGDLDPLIQLPGCDECCHVSGFFCDVPLEVRFALVENAEPAMPKGINQILYLRMTIRDGFPVQETEPELDIFRLSLNGDFDLTIHPFPRISCV